MIKTINYYVNQSHEITVRSFLSLYANVMMPLPTVTIEKWVPGSDHFDTIADEHSIPSLSEDILDMVIIHAEYRPKFDEIDGLDGIKIVYQKVGYFYLEVLG